MTLPLPDAIAWYDRHAATMAAAYEGLPAAVVHGGLADLLPAAPALVLDVGAGSGHDVVAVEPAAGLWRIAEGRHPSPRIRWLDDRLPALATTTRLGLSFDAVLLSAVWMHLAPTERPRALRKLVGLLRPSGVFLISLRHGPAEPERGMHPVDLAELERLACGHGLTVVRVERTSDALGRAGVSWTRVALRLPDDGTGALPLLRHLVLNDAKSSTYKLGLLRALCRAADGAAGLAHDPAEVLDIDHCLPWSAWPCGDLWNLLPAHRLVNQRLKRDRLPAQETLGKAGEAIQAWWERAYLGGGSAVLPRRFAGEARASCRGWRARQGRPHRRRCSRPCGCSGCGCATIRGCLNGWGSWGARPWSRRSCLDSSDEGENESSWLVSRDLIQAGAKSMALESQQIEIDDIETSGKTKPRLSSIIDRAPEQEFQ